MKCCDVPLTWLPARPGGGGGVVDYEYVSIAIRKHLQIYKEHFSLD